MMSDYNIDLGERRVSSVPASMAKIVVVENKQMNFTLIFTSKNPA